MMKYFEVHFRNMDPVYYQSYDRAKVIKYLDGRFWGDWTTIEEIECRADLKFEFIKYVCHE